MNFDEFVKKHPAKFVTVNGKKYEYLTGGQGKTGFLIFPGSGQDALSCFDLISEFETKYKTIAINYTGIFNVDMFFNYINKVLQQENIDNVILYGLSLGGFLAQHYMRRYPKIVNKVILSHSGTTRSKTIIRRVAIPGKVLFFFLPILPQTLLNKLFKPVAGRVQTGNSNWMQLYKKYSSEENLKLRLEFAKKSTFSLLDKTYIKSVYKIGLDLERLEKNFRSDNLKNWRGKILIIRTENDPLAQDDGMFKIYYPKAKVVTFHNTGHLTPFIQYEKMAKVIWDFVL